MRFVPPSTAEAQRVASVAKYDILDTNPEADFDNLALLARTICQTPIATIGILDSEREWFKASSGIELSELPLNDSFSTRAIAHPQVLVVPDTAQNSRFANLSLVKGDAAVRFFAGAPLITRSGSVIGALSVMDRVPRSAFSIEKRSALQVLASQVVAQLDLRRTVRDLALALCQKQAAIAALSAFQSQPFTHGAGIECPSESSNPVSLRPRSNPIGPDLRRFIN